MVKSIAVTCPNAMNPTTWSGRFDKSAIMKPP
jgi:hypothetical protein